VIVISDMWNAPLAAIDCSNAVAQEVFDELHRDFARAGWEFGDRYFDNAYMRRGNVRSAAADVAGS
jgi:hypothetical protein